MGVQVAVPRAGGCVSPRGASLVGKKISPPPGCLPTWSIPLQGLLVGKGDCYIVSLRLWCLGDLGPKRVEGRVSFQLPACLSVCHLLFPLFLSLSLPLVQLSLRISLFLCLLLGPGSLSPSFSPPLLSPLSRFFSFLSGEQRRSALPRGMSSKKLQF